MRAEVTIDEKREVIVTLIPTDEENLVRGITVKMEDEAPIMRTPFYSHGKRLHSICSLIDPDAIDRVDW